MPDLPRALSIEPGTEHYRPDCKDIGPKLRVFLDGVYMEMVIAFDCDAGWIKRYITDHEGRVLLADSLDCFKSEVVRGRVEVFWREGAHA